MLLRRSPAPLLAALVLSGAGTMPVPAHAQAPAPEATQAERLRNLEQRLDASQKQIEKLIERIAELERAAAQARLPAGAAPATEQAKAIEALRETVDQISEGLSRTVNHTGVPIHGFADAGAGWSSREDPMRLRGFNVGTLDLYLTPQIGGHVKSLMEIAFYYDAQGRGEIEAERMQIGYTLDDALTLWAGRFHTPLGLWNTAYHHGANLQTSIFRPRFIDFEDRDGLLPTHSVGVWGTGKIGLGNAKALYDLYITNGPTIRNRTLDYNAFTDDSGGKLLGFNLALQPGAGLRGLTLGIHGLGATVQTRAASGSELARTRLRMAGAYFGYDAQGWESIGEFYRFANSDPVSGTRHSSNAWFAQVGRTLGALTPYARYERASLDGADNYFATQQVGRSYSRASLGARYELDAKSALKIEFGQTREAAATLIDDNGLAATLPRLRYQRTAVEYSIAF